MDLQVARVASGSGTPVASMADPPMRASLKESSNFSFFACGIFAGEDRKCQAQPHDASTIRATLCAQFRRQCAASFRERSVSARVAHHNIQAVHGHLHDLRADAIAREQRDAVALAGSAHADGGGALGGRTAGSRGRHPHGVGADGAERGHFSLV